MIPMGQKEQKGLSKFGQIEYASALNVVGGVDFVAADHGKDFGAFNMDIGNQCRIDQN